MSASQLPPALVGARLCGGLCDGAEEKGHACTPVHMMTLAHRLDTCPPMGSHLEPRPQKRQLAPPQTGWILQPSSHSCFTCESWSICQRLGGFLGKCFPRFKSLLWFGVVPWPPSYTVRFASFQWIPNWNQLQIRRSKNLNCSSLLSPGNFLTTGLHTLILSSSVHM